MNFRKQLMPSHAGFQMAPMVDIMFILLVFFMVSSLYVQWETRVDVTVPSAESGVRATRQAGEIIVNIDEAGNYFVNEVRMEPGRLASLLANVSEQFPNQPVIIRADGQTPHASVVRVLDICRRVDIWNIAYATLPEDGT